MSECANGLMNLIGSGAKLTSSRDVFIINAWPVLEWYRLGQSASRHSEAFLQQAANDRSTLLISRVNYGEIWYKVLDYLPVDDVLRLLRELARYVNLISVDDDLIDEAALLKFQHRASHADCFAAALAIRHNAPVMTGDPDFLRLQTAGLLTVEWLGA